MGRESVGLLSFNKGIISSLGLARTDLGARIAMSAQDQSNWMPRALGSMMLRPGMGYIGNTRDNLLAKSIEFVFSLDDTARLELTGGALRVWVDDAVISRAAVTSMVTNTDFLTDLTGWTDNDEAGAVSSWATGGYLSLVGSGASSAIRDQMVVCSPTGTPHALRFKITRGEVSVSVGSTLGDDDLMESRVMTPGNYSIEFTPDSNFYIRFSALTTYASLVDYVFIDAAGAMALPTIWLEPDLPNLRYVASGDVTFVSCKGRRPQKIVRYGVRSWAVIDDVSNDGPMRLVNSTPTTITASAIVGDITLTASKKLFKPGHIGALFSINSTGQTVQRTLNGANQFSDPILVTGILGDRLFNIEISGGPWVGTITLQRSVGVVGAWTDVAGKTWTSNVIDSYNDGNDNSIIYYRIGFKTGDFTSGSAVVKLTYFSGSITGYVRITDVASPTSASAIVLKDLGGTTASDSWSEGYWSDYRGYPGANTIHENRKWAAGKDRIWATVSGSFSSFDDATEGDSGPISKSIGYGPIDIINWLVSAERLLVGAQLSEITVRSSSLDEPLTPTASSIKSTSTQGSAAAAALNVDGNAIFIQRCRRRLYSMLYDTATYGYGTQDLTSLSTEIASTGFIGLAVQRQPDTRIHAWRKDGKVAVLIFDKAENVNCWVLVETDGFVEDVCILPGEDEDTVYYQVRRVINGNTVRFYEKWALESECHGTPVAKHADAFKEYSGVETTIITGLAHLEGESVVCWGWNTINPFLNDDGTEIGRDMGSFTVSGGQITGLPAAVTDAVVGLPYEARYKSTKLAYASQKGTALTQPKKVNQLGVIMKDTHAQGLRYGPSYSRLDSLPRNYKGKNISADEIYDEYDGAPVAFPGTWNTDSRLCLVAAAPRPCTLLAAIIELEEVDT